ncbi:MAG TPA: VCBS repeat-containing protein [Microlunatus sp.]
MVARNALTRIGGGLVATLVVGPLTLIPPAYAAAEGCSPGLRSDFNGDGRSDTAVADTYATVNGQVQAGRVIVLYGDADGRIGEGAKGTVAQGAGTVGGVAEAGDRFGSALAVADLDCDGFTDLVVGTPLEDISGQADSGYVQIIWGGVAGLGAGENSRQLTQNDFPNADITAGDQFGFAVDALEDVGQGGTPAPDAFALAIGVPGGNIGGLNDSGWVGMLHALDGGNVATGISQNSTGVPGSAETGDRFGAAVSINQLLGGSGSTVIDLVVGVPNEDVGSVADAGAIAVIKDVYDEEFPGSRDFHQDSPGVPGTAEAGDQFGRSLDTVRVGGTTRLAVGVPGEDVGSDSNAGAVQLFSSNNVTITTGANLTQDTADVTGVTESGDLFGDQLAFAAPGLGDTTTRLAVSAPSEDGTVANQGMVQVFPITDLDAETSYSQDSAGVPGTAEAGDQFGRTLAFVGGATERAWIIGVPDDVGNSSGMVNVIPLGGGAPRSWAPGVGGIPVGGASRFGGAVASVHGGTT